MIINHNVGALNTLNKLNANSLAQNKNLAKLSSGYRINSAADDAAGLAISEKMRNQIRGLDQATRNCQDGISLIQTAEGALQEEHEILKRMRELAVEAANGTNSADDRAALQNEVNQLIAEVDRISQTTQFNTMNLLDGTLYRKVTAAVASVDTSALIRLTGGGSAVAATVLSALANADGNILGVMGNDVITVSYSVNGTFYSNSLTVASGVTTLANVLALCTAGATAYGTAGGTISSAVTITASAAGYAGSINGLVITVKDANGIMRDIANNTLNGFTETTAAQDLHVTDGTTALQIGANENQMMMANIGNMGARALGIIGMDVSTVYQANVTIQAVDTAVQKVSAQRAALGAYQNRMEHTVNNLVTASENLTASESRIRDVDMAKEMSEYTKNSILVQSATAMLAQANQIPQTVLQLLQ